MNAYRYFLSTLLCLLLPLGFAQAKEQPSTQTPHALLWRIEHPGLAPSWLFGTIHINPNHDNTLPDAVNTALGQSRMVLTEIKLTPFTMAATATAMLNHTPGQTKAMLGAADYEQLQKILLQRHGMNESAVDKLTPWALWMVLIYPPEQKGQVAIDQLIAQRANTLNKQYGGLETVEEQLALFRDIDSARMARILRQTMKHLDEADQQRNKLLALYQSEDLDALLQLSQKDEPPLEQIDLAWSKQWLKQLIDKRNLRMMQRMQPRLNKGGVFVAVGAAHLAGKHGLIALLQKQGYRLIPIPVNTPTDCKASPAKQAL